MYTLDQLKELKKQSGLSHQQIADELGYKYRENVKGFFRTGKGMSADKKEQMVNLFKSRIEKDIEQKTETISLSMKGDSIECQRPLSKDPSLYSPEALCEEFGIDSKLYDVTKFKGNKRTVTPASGEAWLEYSGTAVFTKKKDADQIQYDEAFKKCVETLKGGKKFTPALLPSGTDNMLVMPLYDIHVGKKGVDDSGFEELQRDVLHSVSQILSETATDVDKIYIPIDGDFLNTDNKAGTTAKGTPQTNTDPWDVMFNNGITLLREIIEIAETYSQVEVVLVSGNHAHMSVYHLVKVLEAWYKKDGNVSFSLSTRQRNYIHHGKVLICMSHGDKDGRRIVEAMISEKTAEFGSATFRCIMTGHLHHTASTESFKTMHFKVGTPALKDDFHDTYGYVGAYRKIEVFKFNKTHLTSRNMKFVG